MFELESFIGQSYRPEINGGRLDKDHKTKFLLDCFSISWAQEIEVSALAFGPKNDKVLLNLEYAIAPDDDILVWYYEDIHKRWSYVQTNTESYFLFRKNQNCQYKIKPSCIYIRGCQVDIDDEYWLKIGEFYNFIDTWDGKIICSPKAQNNNESKLYQLTTSLKAASRGTTTISIGRSFVIKGQSALNQLQKNKSYIVKSLSGVRSIVVDEKEFKKWNHSNLNNLPVLFQEKVEGNDLRVHVVNGNVYGKISLEKHNVDYRYDSQFWFLKDFNDFPKELRKFCIDVTICEDNALLGIDFIIDDNKYVVLEANPSPGWSAYHQCNGIENDAFIKDLLWELQHV